MLFGIQTDFGMEKSIEKKKKKENEKKEQKKKKKKERKKRKMKKKKTMRLWIYNKITNIARNNKLDKHK